MTTDFRHLRNIGRNGYHEKEEMAWYWGILAFMLVFVTTVILASWMWAVIGNNPNNILPALLVPIGLGMTALYLKNNYRFID